MGGVVAIIQARATGSTRMGFSKVLAKLDGERTMLECVVDRVRMAQCVDSVMVALPALADEHSLALRALIQAKGWPAYYGSEHDVLHRYRMAAELAGAAHVVRVTADCPFIGPEAIDETVILHHSLSVAYTCNNWGTDDNPAVRQYAHGMDCEVMTMSALEALDGECQDAYSREHVTVPFRGRDGWQVGVVMGQRLWSQPGLRLTVDTPEDLEVARALYAILPRDFTTAQLMDACREHPEILAKNGSVWR